MTEILTVGESWFSNTDDASVRIRWLESMLAIMRYGQVEGEHHKAWVIDQVTRALFGEAYEKYVAAYKKGDAGPNTHEWNESVAP